MNDTTKNTTTPKATDKKTVKKTAPKTNTKLDKLVEIAKSEKVVKEQLSFKLDPVLVKTMKAVSTEKNVNLTAIVEAVLKDAFSVK